MSFVDLHTHSVHSDGTFTIKEIVSSCCDKNIKYLSITDHDTINGLEEARCICLEKNINFINGIEFSADFKGEEIHILAYGFDTHNEKLLKILDLFKTQRTKRNEKMLLKLKDFGINIDYNKLSLEKNSTITRGDIAMEIFNLGFAKNTRDAFNKYVSKSGVAYVKKEAISYKQILCTIKEINAISSLAHPNIYNFYNSNLKTSISELKRSGLDAIECYHSSYSQNVTNTLLGYCNRYDLLVTGGSDFHGYKKKDVFLGQATNNQYIDYKLVSDIINKLSK